MTQKRCVRFNQKKNAFLLPVKRITKSESLAVWYSSQELRQIRLDLRCSLKNLSSSGNSSPNLVLDEESDEDNDSRETYESFHWRGLEHIKNRTISSSVESRQELVRSVLALQKLHKAMGLKDDVGLTLFTRAFTKEATEEAALRAQQDFDEALRIYNEGTSDDSATRSKHNVIYVE